MWTAFMKETLESVPEATPTEPPGIETVRVDAKTGEPASGDGTVLEIFMDDNLPEAAEGASAAPTAGQGESGAASVAKTMRERTQEVEQLF